MRVIVFISLAGNIPIRLRREVQLRSSMRRGCSANSERPSRRIHDVGGWMAVARMSIPSWIVHSCFWLFREGARDGPQRQLDRRQAQLAVDVR